MALSQRIGQVLVNATNGADLFYWTDTKLAEAIHAYLDGVLSLELRAASTAGAQHSE